MKIFRLMSMQKPEILTRLIRRLPSREIVVILDLEDALWDPMCPERTPELKKLGRSMLETLARNDPQIFLRYSISIRLNRGPGLEFDQDVATLARISRDVRFCSLVLTKIESSRQFLDCVRQLDANRIGYENLMPIIETQAGMDNLEDILDTLSNKNVERLVYGHYDYCLDSGKWPFLEYEDADYWEFIAPLVWKVESRNLHFVHPPHCQIYDDDQLSGLFFGLRSMCRQPFGIITLGERQARHCLHLSRAGSGEGVPGSRPPLRGSKDYSPEEMACLADATRRSFEGNRRSNVSFALDPVTGRFISPHAYLAAIRYLSKIEDERSI